MRTLLIIMLRIIATCQFGAALVALWHRDKMMFCYWSVLGLVSEAMISDVRAEWRK